MPASRQAIGADFSYAIDTSNWRSSITICSALNLFFGMTKRLSKLIFSQRLVQKSLVRSRSCRCSNLSSAGTKSHQVIAAGSYNVPAPAKV